MGKVLKLVAAMSALFYSAGVHSSVQGSNYGVEDEDQLYGIDDMPAIVRSYHAATFDHVIGKMDHPFNYSSSSLLGRVVRASAFLGGYVRAASEDPSIKEQLLDGRDFCIRILNFYVLWFEAQLALMQQLRSDNEKSHRLLEELYEFRSKVFLLRENFETLIDEKFTHATVTVRMVLDIIAMQTGQILAV